MFRNNTYIRKHAQCIHVTEPARDNMKMQMLLNTGTGHTPQIQTDVESIRLHDAFKNFD